MDIGSPIPWGVIIIILDGDLELGRDFITLTISFGSKFAFKSVGHFDDIYHNLYHVQLDIVLL